MANSSDKLDLAAVRRELEAHRDQTRERLGVLSARPELGTAQGFGKRIGDGTTEAVSRLTDIGVGDSLERVLARTERALVKLEDGTYGICDVCAGPIPAGRMRALPEGGLCLKCAQNQRRAPAPRRR